MKNKLCLLIIILSLNIINLISQEYNYQQINSAIEIFEKANKSVVVILAYDNAGNIYQGSGVVINSDGLIVTNHHVCKDANRIEIKHYDTEIKNINIYKYDEIKDILFLQTDYKSLVPIELGNSSLLKVGQRIYAVGSPEGYENSISEGIVSGFRLDENNVKLIQMTCPITDGSSGGAVLNSQGQLIGLSVSGQHEGSLYFAIPVNDVLSIIGIEPLNTEFTDAQEYYKYGLLADENKNYQEAEKYFTKYIEKFSSDINAYSKRGYARFKLKEYKKAINDFTKVIDYSPSSSTYFYRGNCYYSLKDYTNALQDYNKALEDEPDNFDILYNRGYAFFRLKLYKEAINDWQKTIMLNPEYYEELKEKIFIAESEINRGNKK